MQAGDVTHQVIETVARNAAGSLEVDAVEGLHDISVVGDLEIRDDRLAEALALDVLGVIFPDRDGRIDDVRDDHHSL